MAQQRMTDAEKKEIIRNILGANHSAAGKHFPIFSQMMDGLGTFNDVISFAELIPALSGWLSGSVVSSVISRASFAGILLFPLQQMINLVNANETGLRAYSYRAISYSITAWSFDRPAPMSSPQIISNINSGPITSTHSNDDYHRVWRETSISVKSRVVQICAQKNINQQHLKAVFKALGQGNPATLSVVILKGFESEFSAVTRHIWASNYSIAYPR